MDAEHLPSSKPTGFPTDMGFPADTRFPTDTVPFLWEKKSCDVAIWSWKSWTFLRPLYNELCKRWLWKESLLLTPQNLKTTSKLEQWKQQSVTGYKMSIAYRFSKTQFLQLFQALAQRLFQSFLPGFQCSQHVFLGRLRTIWLLGTCQ